MARGSEVRVERIPLVIKIVTRSRLGDAGCSLSYSRFPLCPLFFFLRVGMYIREALTYTNLDLRSRSWF